MRCSGGEGGEHGRCCGSRLLLVAVLAVCAAGQRARCALTVRAVGLEGVVMVGVVAAAWRPGRRPRIGGGLRAGATHSPWCEVPRLVWSVFGGWWPAVRSAWVEDVGAAAPDGGWMPRRRPRVAMW